MPGKFAERKLPPYALTKADHDELVKERKRPATQGPIARRTKEDKAAPDLSDDWFGFMPSKVVPADVEGAA